MEFDKNKKPNVFFNALRFHAYCAAAENDSFGKLKSYNRLSCFTVCAGMQNWICLLRIILICSSTKNVWRWPVHDHMQI